MKLTPLQMSVLTGRTTQAVYNWHGQYPRYAQTILKLWETAPEEVKAELLEGVPVEAQSPAEKRRELVYDAVWQILAENPSQQYTTYALARIVDRMRVVDVGFQTIYHDYLPKVMGDASDPLGLCWVPKMKRWQYRDDGK